MGTGLMGHRAFSRNKIRENSKRVAVVMQKSYKIPDIDLIVIIFDVANIQHDMDLLAKNAGNPPCGFRDRSIATGVATRFRLRLWMVCDVIRDVRTRA